MDITSIFITGLFAGGLTCLAVQGGLLASSIAQQEQDTLAQDAKSTHHLVPVLTFLFTRLIAYTIVGFLLGSLGSVAKLSLTTRIILQFAAAVFMIGTALNLLRVHPIFRYFIIQPPKFLARIVRNQSKSKSIFGPALLGALTILIPCGATQAMMAYAVTTGSGISGTITMFIFILGTSPLFFILGVVMKKLGGSLSNTFNKFAATAIIVVALYNINGAMALSGSNVTFESVYKSINCTISFCENSDVKGVDTNIVNAATIYLTRSGYTNDPRVINVKAGSTVKLTLINQNGAGCIQAFTIPKLGIERTVRLGTTEEIEFTAPNKPGILAFMCSMGMYRGSINVL